MVYMVHAAQRKVTHPRWVTFWYLKEVTHLCKDLGPPRTDHLGVGHLWVTCAV